MSDKEAALARFFASTLGRIIVWLLLFISALCVLALGLLVLHSRGVTLGGPAWLVEFSPCLNRIDALIAVALAGLLVAAIAVGLTAWHGDDSSRDQENGHRLVEQLAPLRDGDLNFETTRVEGWVGSVAASVDYAVACLRELVVAARDCAGQLSQQAGSADAEHAGVDQIRVTLQQRARAATESVEALGQHVQALSTPVAEMAEMAAATRGVIADTRRDAQEMARSARNTQRSLQAADNRVRQARESSYEVGDAIEQIRDIAEQTDTLALNASIQAAMAGDAGRGFSVVADEVQRLAKRCSAATHGMEELVRSMQNNSSEAVSSVEQSFAAAEQRGQLADTISAKLDELADQWDSPQRSERDLKTELEALTVQADALADSHAQLQDAVSDSIQRGDANDAVREVIAKLRAVSSQYALAESTSGERD